MIQKNYTLTSIQASIEAGQAILDVYHSDFAVELKSDNSPLTLADRRAHDIIVRWLKPFNMPILSEEGRNVPYEKRKNWNSLWIVDPLDGTKEFINRNGEFTVNIALVKDEKPVSGVIYVPVHNTLYFASQGSGAYKVEGRQTIEGLSRQLVGQSISDSWNYLLQHAIPLPLKASALKRVTIVGSRSHANAETKAFIDKQRRTYGRVELISAGSSLKFCMVAEGRADIYPRLGPTMEWDTAAGQAIVENSAAKVVDYHSRKALIYNKRDLLNPWFIVTKKKVPEFRPWV